MEVHRSPVVDKRTGENNIPNPIQKQRTNLSTTKWESAKYGSNYRWSNDLGRSRSILQDQLGNSEVPNTSHGPNAISNSTSDTVGKMDINLEDKVSSTSNCSKRDVEIRGGKDRKDKANITGASMGQRLNQSSHPRKRDPKRARPHQLRRNNPTSSPSILEAGLTNQNSFDPNANKRGTLQELPHDLESQYSQNIPALLNILKSTHSLNETSSDDVLFTDYEINDFLEVFGISNVRPILASDDHFAIWLKKNDGAIYVWCRIDYGMLFIGSDLREALVNYLFHQDKICYVMEFTHEIVPRNKFNQEVANSFKKVEPIRFGNY